MTISGLIYKKNKFKQKGIDLSIFLKIVMSRNIQGFAVIFCVLVVAAAIVGTSGCKKEPVKQKQTAVKITNAPVEEITVSAASDLKIALPDIAKAFEKKTGTRVLINFGSTGELARQIEQGAPVDLFLAANKKYVDDLVAKKLAGEKTRHYATGLIVLIGNAKNLDELKDVSIKNIAIANPEHAPYGMAAKEALQEAGVWSAIEERLVFGENIAQTMEYVKTGNADAGIVALSLVKPAGIRYVDIDEDLYKPIEQWVGLISGSGGSKTARALMEFLVQPEAKKILKSGGFIVPETASSAGK